MIVGEVWAPQVLAIDVNAVFELTVWNSSPLDLPCKKAASVDVETSL